MRQRHYQDCQVHSKEYVAMMYEGGLVLSDDGGYFLVLEVPPSQ